MKKWIAAGMACMALLMGSAADAANIKDHPRVAVMNFGNKAVMSYGLRQQDFSSATEYAIYQLSASDWFDLVDYEQLSTIAKIHSVNMSGLVDPSTVVAMGKFAGAQFMVVGNLTGLTVKENEASYQHGRRGGIGAREHVVTANVAMRIVDIETGRIVVAGLGKGSSTSAHVEISFRKYRNSNNGNYANYGNTTTDPNIASNGVGYYPNDTTGMNDVSYDNNQTSSPSAAGYEAPSGDLSGSNPGAGEMADVIPVENGNGTIGGRDVVEPLDAYSSADSLPEENGSGITSLSSDGYPDASIAIDSSSGIDATAYPDTVYTDSSSSAAAVTDNSSYYNTYEEMEEYKITIGTVQVSVIQVRNAISKAVRDGIYGKMGLLTTLNGGKPLKIKTGF